MPLKPEIIEFLKRRATANLPEVYEAPISVIRANTQNHPILSAKLPEIFSVQHKNIAGPTADLPIRIYRANDLWPNHRRESKPAPSFRGNH